MTCETSPLPTPVVVVVVERHGAVVGWPLVVPGERPLVGIPLRKDRRTLQLIRQVGSFSLNLVHDAERAYEVFGRPGEDKLERWGNWTRCRAASCLALGDAARVVECIYEGEVDLGDYALVLCRAVRWEGCGEYAVWDPCGPGRRRPAE